MAKTEGAVVPIRLNEEEKKRIYSCAKAEYLPVSTWMKKVALLKCDKLEKENKE